MVLGVKQQNVKANCIYQKIVYKTDEKFLAFFGNHLTNVFSGTGKKGVKIIRRWGSNMI